MNQEYILWLMNQEYVYDQQPINEEYIYDQKSMNEDMFMINNQWMKTCLWSIINEWRYVYDQ